MRGAGLRLRGGDSRARISSTRFGEAGGGRARASWAAALRDGSASYWVETPEGRYPAIALDADQRPVDTLTSNIGHLIGTGILDPAEERHVADAAARPDDVVGVRDPHDVDRRGRATGRSATTAAASGRTTPPSRCTACRARACTTQATAGRRTGCSPRRRDSASACPELHSGDPATATRTPTPYPAACRPQAWSAAAAAVACARGDRRRGATADVSRPVATVPAGETHELVEGQREHRMRRAAGRPDLRERGERLVDDRRERRGVPGRSDTADRLARGLAHLLRASRAVICSRPSRAASATCRRDARRSS